MDFVIFGGGCEFRDFLTWIPCANFSGCVKFFDCAHNFLMSHFGKLDLPFYLTIHLAHESSGCGIVYGFLLESNRIVICLERF